VVRFNCRGRSTSDDLQGSVDGSGRASLRGVVANAFLTQLDTRWRLWGDWILFDRYERNRCRKGDVRTTITGSHPSPYRFIFSGLLRHFHRCGIPIHRRARRLDAARENELWMIPSSEQGEMCRPRMPCPWWSETLVSDKVTMDGLRT